MRDDTVTSIDWEHRRRMRYKRALQNARDERGRRRREDEKTTLAAVGSSLSLSARAALGRLFARRR